MRSFFLKNHLLLIGMLFIEQLGFDGVSTEIYISTMF